MILLISQLAYAKKSLGNKLFSTRDDLYLVSFSF